MVQSFGPGADCSSVCCKTPFLPILPSNTILFRAEGLRVGVVQNGRVHLQPISIGHDYGATVEITSGLSSSDQIILNPSDSLAEGQQVNVEERA